MDERYIARFNARVDVRGPDECWPWTARCNRDGYGILWIAPQQQLAHRVAFFLMHGRWPEPCGLHSCDNPPCCNVRHLFEGDAGDNIRDCVAKGRHSNCAAHYPDRLPRGERVGTSKLTAAQVFDIIALGSSTTGADLARRFGVGRAQISRILSGKRWQHLRA